MSSFYVISTQNKSGKNKYKLGRHTGSEKLLRSRYRTYLINPVIFYFGRVINPIIIEANMFDALKDFIIYDENGIKTEWVCLELYKIIQDVIIISVSV